MRWAFVALAAATALLALYALDVWPINGGPHARLTTGPAAVHYDAAANRLTVTVDLQNSGERQTMASITSAVFIDSRKQPLNDRSAPQPWRTELTAQQFRPVIFVLEGDAAAATWNGLELLEITIDASYDGTQALQCNFEFMGRFYPQIKQIGTVSTVTSPAQCR